MPNGAAREFDRLPSTSRVGAMNRMSILFIIRAVFVALYVSTPLQKNPPAKVTKNFKKVVAFSKSVAAS